MTNTAPEFIIAELKKFIEQFPKTRVRYENHWFSNSHFVEILPNEIYHSDEAYIEWENNFWDLFVQHYPDQNICFISDDAMVKLEQIDAEFVGTAFHPSLATQVVD